MTQLEEMDLSVRSFNCLKRTGIDTVEALTSMTREQFRSTLNLGSNCMDETEARMKELGLSFREETALKKQYMTDRAQYAFNVHAQIQLGKQQIEDGLYLMAKGLKLMRDDKLYLQMGYNSFQEYCERGCELNRAQVYKYISLVEQLPETFVQSTGQIGAEKLNLLAKLDPEERDNIAENTDLESVTVKELKAKIEELKCENDILTEQNGTLESDNNALTAQVDDLMENGRVKWDTHEIDRQKIYRAKSLYDVAKNAFLDLSRLAKNEPVTQKIFNDLLNFIDDERNDV